MNTRAQIKMFETIGVLVVFFFILIAGAAFYFSLQESSLQKELAQQAQLRSLQSAQQAAFLPELDCSFVGVARENCFDTLKLDAFAGLMRESSNRDAYFGLFGFANITVRQAYPALDTPVPLYLNPPPEYRRILRSHLPVLLYNPVSRDFAFGIMEVSTYAGY
jgi:hypothetical protein